MARISQEVAERYYNLSAVGLNGRCRSGMRCYSITSSARFEISVDGMPRLHRDRKEIAIQAAARLMIKYPHSLVAVKDLKSGKPGSGRPEAAIAPMLTMRRPAWPLPPSRTGRTGPCSMTGELSGVFYEDRSHVRRKRPPLPAASPV